ncbi:phytanoyl-CoA dioxygenase family protein [Actinomadura sp. CNU-125]|uniref:phytanoyl-CoA dioxygenase family protein n=1 Tax=Actinomadura sp. CNU-125 TaxID=1904961 RepID=UPI00096A9FDC|nr:phytanoyl-CoA dioxygenase family protein [Actinomadura sp. CNU-125]
MKRERITDEHVAELERHGYVLVPGFLSAREVQWCREAAAYYFPDDDELAAAPDRYTNHRKVATFPFVDDALNRITVHPAILRFLERSYGTTRLRLGESTLQVKYGTRFGAGDDQNLHNDTWGKKSLAYPRDDGLFRQTFMILYYTNVMAGHAPTFVVSQEHTRGMDLLTEHGMTVRPPDLFPELYSKETPVHAEAGSLLIFTGSTLHRGTAMTAETGRRLVHFITYHSAHVTWMQDIAWPSGERPYPDAAALRRFIETSSPHERELIGFPAVADPYWDEVTLRGMAARYPRMDIAPYRKAFHQRSKDVE